MADIINQTPPTPSLQCTMYHHVLAKSEEFVNRCRELSYYPMMNIMNIMNMNIIIIIITI